MTETPDVYIGTYVDFNYADSNNPADYTWARFQGVQGEKGEQGIPGIGIDGKTYYLHIKYSNDGGRTFTGNNGEDPGDWLGLLTDLNVNDSTNPADYKWSKTKGEQGDQGIPGSNGSDGADGLIIRRSEWKPNREYRNDQDVPQSVSKIRYLDIVLVRDFGAATGYKVYKCIYTVAPHISSDSNAPGTPGGAAYWEEFTTNVESIYTDLIIAKDAKLDFVSGNAVRVGYESGTNNFTVVAGITGAGGNNGSAIRIWAGATEENRGRAPFRVTQDGILHAEDADISGKIVAKTGELGELKITGMIDGRLDGTNGILIVSDFIKFYGNSGGKADRTILFGVLNNSGYKYMGAFESDVRNSYNTWGNNDALYFNIRGSNAANRAIYGMGDIVMDGDVIGYNFTPFTGPWESNTVRYIPYSRRVILAKNYGSSNSHIGLPSISSVQNELGLQSGDAFCVPMSITVGEPDTQPLRIYGRRNGNTAYPLMKAINGEGPIEYMDLRCNSTVEFLLIYYPLSISIDTSIAAKYMAYINRAW